MFLVFPVWNIRYVKSQNSRTQRGLKFRLAQRQQWKNRPCSLPQEQRSGQIASTGLIRDELHLWWQIHKPMGTFRITMCMLGGYEGTNVGSRCVFSSWSQRWAGRSPALTNNALPVCLWLFWILTSKQWEGEAVSCSDGHPLLQFQWKKGFSV